MKTIEEMKSFERARETYVPEKVNRQDERKMQWFRDSKFGMFIHWGAVFHVGKRGVGFIQ